jgi:hypothetical protein
MTPARGLDVATEPARARLSALPRWAITAGVLILAFGLAVARRPSSVLRPEFFNEDGQVFFLGTFFGSPVETLFRSYQGYLHLVPRLVALLERAVPITSAPLVSNVASLLVVAGVATFAFSRLERAIPSRAIRAAFAAIIVVAPVAAEPLGSLTYAQWYLGVFLVLFLLADPPRSRLGAVLDRTALVLSSLTGPFGIVVSPMYVVAAVRTRTRAAAITAVAVVVPACLQLFLLLTAGGRAPSIHWQGLDQVARVTALRAIVVPFIGTHTGTSLVVAPTWIGFAVATGICAALVVVLVALAAEPERRWTAAVLVAGWIVILGAGLVGSTDRPSDMLHLGYSDRYFFIPGLLIGMFAVAGLVASSWWGRMAAIGLCLVLAVGVVRDFRLANRPYHDWPLVSGCIGGPEPCLVPVQPPAVWSIQWPGPDGPYVQAHLPIPGP